MLTDVFFRRYQDTVIVDHYNNELRALFTQAALLINKQLYPAFDWQGNEDKQSAAVMDRVEAALSMEMGLTGLGSRWYSNGIMTSKVLVSSLITNFFNDPFQQSYSADRYVKFRLSLIELAFRERENEVKQKEIDLPKKIAEEENRRKFRKPALTLPGDFREGMRAHVEQIKAAFRANVDEINTRFRQAGLKYQYHNGFIQGSDDERLEQQVNEPFWRLCSDPEYVNVDIDMKEAHDLRDNLGRDPAWYAARALESTVKIASSKKGCTTGKEKSVYNFIDNLRSSRSGSFLEGWEADLLQAFFTHVRNPFGHGPGQGPMPKLSPQQIDWAIEFCMSWAKNIIRRL